MEAPLVSQTEGERHVPNMDIAQKAYEYNLENKKGNKDKAEILKKELIEVITEEEMGEYYENLCKEYEWNIDAEFLESLKAKNTTKLEEFEKNLEDAKENQGDMEVLDVQFAKARYLSQIGSWKAALNNYDIILEGKKTTSGKKIDASLEKCRIALFTSDLKKMKDFVETSRELIDIGGDWDRRNRLKIYEGLYLLLRRDIQAASKLLLECVATFTCVELCSYEKFMFYAILTNIMCLSRTELNKKVVKDSQVVSTIKEGNVEHIDTLLKSIHDCDYQKFFISLLNIHPAIENDRYLGPHSNYILREYRILAYSQFLEAYKSVMLSSMAASFGIDVQMLDIELARFIADGRLNAKIDKVGDVVQTVRPEKKSAQYQEIIKTGDVLLNSIQRLARVLDA